MDKKNKRILIISLAVVIPLLAAAALSYFLMSEPDGFKTVTPARAMKLIESRNDLIIIDVRGPDELWQGSIKGSVLMPFTEIVQGRMAPPKDRPILLVCAVGGRSLALGRAMIEYGWQEVYNLEGGINAWKRQGLPLTYNKQG